MNDLRMLAEPRLLMRVENSLKRGLLLQLNHHIFLSSFSFNTSTPSAPISFSYLSRDEGKFVLLFFFFQLEFF
jgi:hypothetical protein